MLVAGTASSDMPLARMTSRGCSKLKSDVCCRSQLAPSGERVGGNHRPSSKQRQNYCWVYGVIHVTCGLYTGISSGPNAR